jgi:hypothetical protein
MPITHDSTPDLATRLLEHADNIMNPAMHQLESDLRLAATAIRETDESAPLMPSLVAELRRLANDSQDSRTSAAIFRLLGNLT